MRDALGALGPVDGQNPELSNLTCSVTKINAGDIVFLTSDGVSDNFDPVVGKFCVPKHPERRNNNNNETDKKRALSTHIDNDALNLPVVEAYQRHELTLLRIEDVLNNGVSGSEGPCTTAEQLCLLLIDFSEKLTMAKRRILEDPDLYTVANGDNREELSKTEQKTRRRKAHEKLSQVPGKLDHATVVAYHVPHIKSSNNKHQNKSNKSYNLETFV